MRTTSPPPHKQDNGIDPTHKAMARRTHRDNDHERVNTGEDRIVARGDGGRFPRDADDRNRSPTSREAHPERPVDYKSIVEDRVHGQNDPQRRRHGGEDQDPQHPANGAAPHAKPHDREGDTAQGGRYGLQHYPDEDRRGYEKSYQRARNDVGRFDRSVHDLQKDGRFSRDS